MKYLPRDVADGKMRAMAQGAAVMRREVGGRTRCGSRVTTRTSATFAGAFDVRGAFPHRLAGPEE
jgi:hypothetical protein